MPTFFLLCLEIGYRSLIKLAQPSIINFTDQLVYCPLISRVGAAVRSLLYVSCAAPQAEPTVADGWQGVIVAPWRVSGSAGEATFPDVGIPRYHVGSLDNALCLELSYNSYK